MNGWIEIETDTFCTIYSRRCNGAERSREAQMIQKRNGQDGTQLRATEWQICPYMLSTIDINLGQVQI